MTLLRSLLVCLLVAAPALAQSPATGGRHPEEGLPLIRTFAPLDVNAAGQNWAMVQDARGLIYGGSQSGVTEFDGTHWRLIRTNNLATVRSLAVDSKNVIYAGAQLDFGYLKPDDKGELQYISLGDKVPADAKGFTDVWRTWATPAGVVFQSEQGFFRYANDTITVVKPKSRLNRSSKVGDKIYVTTPEDGLNEFDGTTITPLPGTKPLGSEVYPVVFRYDTQRLLIGTRFNGFFLYDGTALTKFPTELDTFLKTASLYKGIELPDGSFALATTNAGMAIMGRDGRKLLMLDRTTGLPSNAIYNVFADREGAIWTAGERGMARVEYPSPVTSFGETDGYVGMWTMIRHQGRLYLAYQGGVSYLEPSRDGVSPRFIPVSGIGQQSWAFLEMTDAKRPPVLAVASTDGLYEVAGATAKAIYAPRDGTYRAAALTRSLADPTRIWIGLFDGVASFRWVDGKWIDEGRVPGISEQVRSIEEGDDGTVWAGTNAVGLIRLTFKEKPASGAPRPQPTITHYGAKDGLPERGVGVLKIHGRLYFSPWSAATDNTVATWDAKTQTFVKDPVLSGLPHDMLRGSFGICEGPNNTILANAGKGTRMLTPDGKGGWTIDETLFARFGPVPTGYVTLEGDIAWFAFQQRFIRYDLKRGATQTPKFPALVRRVSTGDSVLFGGGPVASVAPQLPSSTGMLRLEYAAPTFIDEEATQYQTKLDGLDTDWTAWSAESRRDFTNLGYGDYRFHVRAKSVTGVMGDEAIYTFSILPPWYRTWWAYGIWALGFMAVAGGAFRVQRSRVVAKERERAVVTEAKLRADSAEQLAQAERERNRNIELLSEIGREITATLDFDTIFGKLYERVNQLADADVFGVGLYDAVNQRIDYRLAIEQGKRYAPYSRSTSERDQLPVWCIEHREPVFINDIEKEYSKYIGRMDDQRRPLEDGTLSRTARSIIYLPLISKDRVLGVVTIQSFEANAYTERHLNMMQSLAAFTAIALDNASAYRQLNEQEVQIRRLFEDAQKARATAEEADAAKSAFLSTVSHELRTPLTSVLGFAKIIKKRLDDRIFPIVPRDDKKVQQTVTQVQENLQVVVSEGERLTKLIDDVLDLAKIEAGKLEWNMEAVSLQDVIDHATAATSSLFEQKGLACEKRIADGLPTITGDRDRLIQVVINLISNAVKFTDTGTVTCTARRQGGELVISVTDTGMGIAPADQAKVFERFKQVGDTLTDKPKGTGLGLPICKEIVEHHGGRIWVESAMGQGSTFSFSLPIGDGAQATLPLDLASVVRQLRDQVEVTTPRTSERQPRILVVDDEANIRALLTQEFTEAGYDVVTASNGREAVAEVRRQRPDLVVLDVMMPEMNGFDVAAVLRNDPATLDIPIVILSIVQDRERGFRLGVDRYLTKPINTDVLFKEVGALLEQRKSHKRVIVVDEDSSAVKTLTDVLTARGYSVTEARTDDLFEKARALQPDIIMLSSSDPSPEVVQTLRFEKGLENVLFLVYR